MGFTNEMGFIDETTHIPTPPTSPTASFVDKDVAVHVLAKNLLAFNNRLVDLMYHLEKAPNMVRATTLTSELRHFLGKDRTSI